MATYQVFRVSDLENPIFESSDPKEVKHFVGSKFTPGNWVNSVRLPRPDIPSVEEYLVKNQNNPDERYRIVYVD